MAYLYESHMGGLFSVDDMLSPEECYCEQCGDSDWLIGKYETLNDLWNLIKDECDINDSGGYALASVYPVIVREFDLPYEVIYEDEYWKDFGFCSNSEKEILRNIEEAIRKENEDGA